MRKKRKKASSIALHSAINHEFSQEADIMPYAIDDHIIRILDAEIGKEIEGFTEKTKKE